MSEGLFPIDRFPKPHETATLPPPPPKPPGYWAQRQADSDQFLDWIKANAHRQRQDARAGDLRADLVAVLGERLKAEIRGQMRGELAPASEEKYLLHIRRFKRFCEQMDVCPLPASDASVAMFLLETSAGDDGPKPALAAQLSRALSLWHQVNEMNDPTCSVYVKAVRRWIREAIPKPPQADMAAPTEQPN